MSKNVLSECMVDTCVRKISGEKTPSSFLIERTCRYAKSGECKSRLKTKPRLVVKSVELRIEKTSKISTNKNAG